VNTLRYGASAALIVVGILSTVLLGELQDVEDAAQIFIFSTLVFMAGVGLFNWGFGRFRRLQLVRDTPTQEINSMSMGTVELKGDAGVVSETLQAPITDTDCVYYEYKVEEYQDSGDDSHWKTIESGESGDPIGIDDGTAAAVVEIEEAEVELPDEDYQEKVKGENEPPQKIQDFIDQNVNVKEGNNEMLAIFDNDRRFTEYYIKPGDHLYVFGYAEEERFEDGTSYPVITDGGAPMFYVTDKSEDYLRDRWGWTYKAMIIAGTLLIPIGYTMMAAIMGMLQS
jgi:hypothetical protein